MGLPWLPFENVLHRLKIDCYRSRFMRGTSDIGLSTVQRYSPFESDAGFGHSMGQCGSRKLMGVLGYIRPRHSYMTSWKLLSVAIG